MWWAWVVLGFKIRSRGWPLKQPEIKIGGQNENFEGHYLLKKFPKAQKEGVMNDPQKPPEIQNWGSFLQNVHLAPMTPYVPF